MLGHGLAGTEPAGDRGGAALGDREQRIDHPLAGNQRRVGVQPLSDRAGGADRPFLA